MALRHESVPPLGIVPGRTGDDPWTQTRARYIQGGGPSCFIARFHMCRTQESSDEYFRVEGWMYPRER